MSWIFGKPVTLFTDHNPTTYLTDSAPKSPKLMRWALAIQRYDVTFCYKAGKANVVADCLSRMDQAVTDKRHSGGVLYPGVGLTIRSTSSYLKLCTVYYKKLFVCLLLC